MKPHEMRSEEVVERQRRKWYNAPMTEVERIVIDAIERAGGGPISARTVLREAGYVSHNAINCLTALTYKCPRLYEDHRGHIGLLPPDDDPAWQPEPTRTLDEWRREWGRERP